MKPVASVFVLAAVVTLIAPGHAARPGASSESGHLITARSAGPVRLGMTVARARRALKGYRLRRETDGEGLALVAVQRGSTAVMNLFAGESNPAAPVNYRAIIEDIEVNGSAFHTREGVHPGMLVSQVEKRYGRLTQIVKSEIESREYASFIKSPAGMLFRVQVNGGEAGRYGPENEAAVRSRRSKTYAPDARLYSISIHRVAR